MSDPPDHGGNAAQSGGKPDPERERGSDAGTLQLFGEELSVAKETVETGRVRVAAHTRERNVVVDEDLARVRVEVERVPVGRRVDSMPEVRQQGEVTIVPVVEEVLVVEKQLVLKEEVRIRRIPTTEHHTENFTLRHQEAVVTRHQPDTSKDDTK